MQKRALVIVLVANGFFLLVEVVGGLVFRSLALLSDAAHMASDVAGLLVALAAQHLMERPRTARHSYGFQRAEVLGGQLNGLVLIGVSVWIMFEAIGRLRDPVAVEGPGMFVIALCGLLVNLFSAVLLARVKGENLNIRGAYLHMLADALSSVGAVVAAILVITRGVDVADPVASIVISLLVLWAAWSLVRETTDVILEAAPRHVRLQDIENVIMGTNNVVGVHHLHVWSIASDVTALSGHIVVTESLSLHDAERIVSEAKSRLSQHCGISHATIEVECHSCDESVVMKKRVSHE